MKKRAILALICAAAMLLAACGSAAKDDGTITVTGRRRSPPLRSALSRTATRWLTSCSTSDWRTIWPASPAARAGQL